MSIYFNPPEQIKFEARELKLEESFDKLTAQMKGGERLFCLAYRDTYPQCIYLHSPALYHEYLSVIRRIGYIDGFFAMSDKKWQQHFSTVSRIWYQQGISKHEEMTPLEDLFWQEE